MIRRGLAGLVLTVSLLAASVAWSAFASLHTVLDPGRSQRVADAVLDDPAARDQLAGLVAAAFSRSLPAGTPFTDADIDRAARAALEDPRTKTAIETSIVASHQRALGQTDTPVTVDAGAFGAATADALRATRPELAGAIPDAPQAAVTLPTERLPSLGWLRDLAGRVVGPAAAVALAGIAFAFAVGDRSRTLTRTGRWAVGAGLVWIAVAYGAPALLRAAMPGSAALGSAVVGAMTASMIPPAAVLAAAGAATYLTGRGLAGRDTTTTPQDRTAPPGRGRRWSAAAPVTTGPIAAHAHRSALRAAHSSGRLLARHGRRAATQARTHLHSTRTAGDTPPPGTGERVNGRY